MDQKLIDFVLKQAGGEEAVKKAFYREEMTQALKKAKTLEEVIAATQDPEWGQAALALTRQEVVELLGGGKLLSTAPKAEKPAKRHRLTKDEVEVLRSRILEVLGALGKDEALSAGEIAEQVGEDVDTRTVALQIKTLREAGQVEMQGSRWSACYFLAAS